MVVGGPASAFAMPPAEPAILLVALDLAIRSHNLMALIDRSFEIRGGDPIVMEIDAHAIGEIHPHLDGVVGVDAIAQQTFFLADCRKRHRLAAVIMIDQVNPMRSDVTKG